jgi:predicted kinase
MKKIFIFRGPPASGKGTITSEFIKIVPNKVAYIELDKFRWGFHLYNRKVPDISEEEHYLAYKNYLSVLQNYLENGSYTIVTEGLFSWDKNGAHGNMQDIINLCKKFNYQYYPILLHAEYDVLWQRNKERKYSVPEEEFKMLYDYVVGKQSDDEIKINVGKSSIEESIDQLKKLIS